MPEQDPYANSAVSDYAQQLANPAAPAGLTQTVKAAHGVKTEDGQYADSSVGKYAAENGYVSQAPSWYTGANTEGTTNGWDTAFTQKFLDGQDKAAADGTMATYFDQPDATGVVTWDHTSVDGRHDYHFGDVFEDGKKVANLYDPKDGGFDKDTANLAMSAWFLDGKQMGRVLSDGDPMAALDRAVTDYREENNSNAGKAATAADFAQETKDREADMDGAGWGDLLAGGAVLGGAATGAGAGAVIGSVVPGAGTVAGGVIGGLLGAGAGAVGGILNRDELEEQAARAAQITELAGEQNGGVSQVFTGLKEWSGVAQSLTSPLVNIEHGIVDTMGKNKVGDLQSGYYAVDKHGDSTRPLWAKPLSLGANVADGLLNFMSPIARTIYTAQMGGSIVGEAGNLAATGTMFDPREGRFDNIFVDDKGNLDPVSGLAGLMKLSIDVVQLGGLRGLARTTGLSRDAVAAGERETEIAGAKIFFDEAGNVTGKRKTFSLLAPSEQTAYANATRKARVAAMTDKSGARPVTADDFYRAATSLATGSNRLKQALWNGFGEGYEEFAQALLEPLALDGQIHGGDVADAFLQGSAAGLGMSAGATFGAPTRDQRLKSQAFVMETMRRNFVEPPQAEWDALWDEATDQQKRVMASRSESDVKLTVQALERLSENQAATLIASGPDVAKARDAKRTAVERDLATGSGKTDRFHVMSGTIDATTDARAEAVEAGALTIARLLDSKLKGLGLQAQTMADRVTELQGDPEKADLVAQAAALVKSIELSRAVGANLVADVTGLVNQIYDPATSKADAQLLVEQTNKLLEAFFDRTVSVAAPTDADGNPVQASASELSEAGAQFATLLHSREPKLDTGSYVALLPRISWDLTSTRSENLLQVNVDILQQINGDFDGDKLRSEYQLILPQERYLQARSGQLLGGRGPDIDVSTRLFDEAMVRALGSSAAGPVGDTLTIEANATLDKIEDTISDRYRSLMSTEALDRVFKEFRSLVRAGNETARTTLLNSLAREASGPITDLGRAGLNNEWLWVSKVVRRELQLFQTSYWKLRTQAGAGPSATEPVADIDTPKGTNARKAAAVTDAETLALFAPGNTLFRMFQKIHYSIYGASVLSGARAEPSDLYEMVAFYAELARGVTRAELDRVGADDTIGGRVLVMLSRLVESALDDPELAGQLSPSTAMSVLANVKVQDVWQQDGVLETDHKDISLVQLLMRRALEADRVEHRATFDTDEKLQAKHARLRSMTKPNGIDGEVNAERAFLEVFGSVPFQDSLGRVTGAFAGHTTPEQWLRGYIQEDAEGRRQQELLHKNVPEYLDRKESSNLPYTLAEASRREVTPYRSMLDALMAVGRSELTFEPNTPVTKARDAFGGRRAEVSHRAVDELAESHRLVLEAADAYRTMANRRSGDRVDGVELIQEMFQQNFAFGRSVLETIPDAAANALFEYTDEGGLYVAPWIYKMFTIEDSAEAVMFYWKNLALTQRNALQGSWREKDTENSGSSYRKIQSRFQQLLFQLAQEPGQLHYEVLIREMDRAKNIDQFFLWLNKTPGFRSGQAPLLPFNDDVADFEADAGGGWTTARASTDLRQAISAVRRGAEVLRDTVTFQAERDATDGLILNGIKRARDGDPEATPTDHENLLALERVVAASHVLPRGFAPSAMLALTRGVVNGFDAHSQEKGVTPTSFQGLADFQMLMDAFGFLPNQERALESLTAHSIDSLSGNAGDLGKHGGTAMDAFGRPIEWEQMDLDQAIELLSDSRTAPLAHTLLTPSALDVVNGKLTERLMTEATLKDLLDNKHYKDLFNLDGDQALNRAMKLLWLVDARARAAGGHFDVIRYVDALALTRTTGLGHESTEDERDRISKEAYLATARAVVLLGQILSTPEMRDGTTLPELRKRAVKLLRDRNKARRLPGAVDENTGQIVQEWVTKLLNTLRLEKAEELTKLTGLSDVELLRRTDLIEKQYEASAGRINAVLEDDLTGAIINRFHVTGDPAADREAHAQITEYAMAMSSPERMLESISIWTKLANQRYAGNTPDLTASEWEQLSRSVMGVYLADQTLRVATHVSIPPFEKGDPTEGDARFHKYTDPAYTFIATDLLRDDSPTAEAITWLYTLADQERSMRSLDDLEATLKRTVLDDKGHGAWTTGWKTHVVEGETRIDSAAAGPGIAAPGNGPKRWGAIGLATTRESTLVPGPELLTTVGFTGDLLAKSANLYRELPVTPAGHTEASTMPVAQLDNRYFSSVRVNGVEVPLTRENMGFAWAGEEALTGYRYIALPRLAQVLSRIATEQKVELADLAVEVDFFHPDSRPEGWMHNIYFDGMSHSLLPDGAESLIATLWSDNGGKISEDTQYFIDSTKHGRLAAQPFVRFDDVALAEAADLWLVDNDLAAMLRRKTELWMRYDDGNGPLEVSDYNAAYKTMSLFHIVAGTKDGAPAAMTAEEVIAFQAANGKAAPLPLDDARLVQLSPDVLRTMLGETGDQGVPRFFADEYLLNPDLVDKYQGVTETMLAWFGDGWLAETGGLADTTLTHIGMQRVLKVKLMLTDAERNARQERIVFLSAEQARVQDARHDKLKGSDTHSVGANTYRTGYVDVLKVAGGLISPERNTFDFQGSGVPIGPRNVGEADHSLLLLDAYKGVANPGDYSRGWRIRDKGGPDFLGGTLNVESLDQDRPLEHHLVKDDFALVELKTFERFESDINGVQDRVEKALRYLVNSGATISIGVGDGSADLRFFASTYLEEHGYSPVAGSRHIFVPDEFSLQSQNERAYESTLTETGTIRPARNAVTYLAADPIGADENLGVLNPASTKLRDRKLLSSILPSSTYQGYNILLDDNRDSGLYARTLAHLRKVTDPTEAEHRKVLLKQAGPDPAGVMPIELALQRFHDKITRSSSLQPEVGSAIEEGDIIAFVNPVGKVVLYRHGFKTPRFEDLERLHAEPEGAGLNVALAESETEPLATTSSGVITDVSNRVGYGRTLAIETPLQAYGDKVQLEGSGMKYVTVPPAHLADFLKVPIFANGTVIDLMSDVASADKKEAYGGRVHGLRNALAFYQFDFTDDLVKFFFPDESTRDPDARMIVYTLLTRVSQMAELKIPMADAHILAQAPLAVADVLAGFAVDNVDSAPADWVDRFHTDEDPSTMIARAVITYLLSKGAHVDNVLKSAGFSHKNAGSDLVTARQVPGLFASLLGAGGLDSPVHAELFRRFDGQHVRLPSGAGFKLHRDWTVEIFDGKGSSLKGGYLQFGEAHSSGDNPVLDEQAYDETEAQAVSAHNAVAGALSLGVTTAHKALTKSRAFAKSFSRGGGVVKPGNDGESLWAMLTALPSDVDTSVAGWRREAPAETVRRELARNEIVGLFQPLNTDDWTDEQRDEYEREALAILNHLHLFGSRIAMVDTWVRQHLGRPHNIAADGHERGVIPGAAAVQAVKDIRINVMQDNLLPHAGADIPLIDLNHLTTLYMANMNRADGWAPIDPATGVKAVSWDAWVETAFGTAWSMKNDHTPDRRFDQVYLLAVDGLMHGYQNATSSTRYLPVSSDTLRQQQLMDPQTNRMLVSISADENLLATDPTLFNTTRAGLDEIIGGQRIYADGRDGPDPASAMGQQQARVDRWRKEVAAPRPTRTTMRGVRGSGQSFLGHSTTTNAFFRSMFNLRVGNALFNVALVVWNPIEAFYRRTIDLLADVAVGESTGAIGRTQTRISEKFADKAIGAVAEALGWQTTYSSDEHRQLNSLVDALSTLPEFKALVYKELTYQYPSMPGIGRVEKWLETYAKVGARFQDPAWGMLPKDLARLYVKTAMRANAADPTGENVFSIQRLLTELPRNPDWLKTNDLATHNMAIAAISNVRSVKPSVISMSWRGVVDPLASNAGVFRNSAGNMLKMMTVFQNFWANSVINMTGLQGAADLAAFHFDGRKKGKLVRRMQAALAGEVFDPDQAEFYDMTEVLEGMDVADSFIRGGVTHTALFTLGMMAGSLGLTGEDDEERWRRRAAEQQGAGFVLDPRQLQNDFRNKDSIFLNWLPFGLDSYFRVDPSNPDSQSMAQMNWTLRYFMSPVIGFERFYENGDFTEVIHGFHDALGAHPVVNTQLVNEFTATAAELHQQANDAVEAGDPVHGSHLLITAVGVLERMVLENSMVNMIYVGRDRYDRDPYKVEKIDSDGNQQLDVRGNPYAQDSSLKEYVDDNGTPTNTSDDVVKQAYVDRDSAGATIRSFTENRFGLALLGSLATGLTGGGFTGSDMFRQNMAVKTRTIELAPTDQGQIEADLLAAFKAANDSSDGGVQMLLTEGEAAQIIKKYYEDRGVYWHADEVEKQAKVMAAQSGMAAMSQLDAAGREHITDDGARAVFEGLKSGAVGLGDAALNGVYISMDQRNKIRDDLSKDLVQEGVDMHMSLDQATWRMRRIMMGVGTEAGTPKLIDLIYTDQLPYSDKMEYNQLNTTYVMGPNGYPMATGFTRDGLMGALGLKPVNRLWQPSDTGLDADARANTVDGPTGINTGLRALEARPESWQIPSIEDVTKQAAKDIIDAIKGIDFTPSTPYAPKTGSGYGGYGGYGGYHSGYHHFGGYGGGGGSSYFTKMYAPPGGTAPFGNSIPFINTSNPIIRRADVRRERVWSERGRLKQWQ